MKFSQRNRKAYLFIVVIAIFFGYVEITEIRLHYFVEWNGLVIEKQQIPPKKMPDLLIKGNSETFPTWKWDNIDFDSVHIGDSIVKHKYEYNAYWFKKLKNGKFDKIKLKYWRTF